MSKEYVINTSFLGDPVGYFIRVNDTSWDEIYDPKFATTFSSKKKAIDWFKENTTFGEYATAMLLSTAIRIFETTVKDGCIVRRSFELVDQSKSRPYNSETDTLDDVIKFFIYNYENEELIRYEDYKTWPALYNLTNHLWSVYSCHDDNYDHLYSVEIFTRRDGEFSNFESEVMSILDYITVKDDDGRLILPVIDHHLSECGHRVDVLYDRENDKWFVNSRYDTPLSFKNMETMFNYLKLERYYD